MTTFHAIGGASGIGNWLITRIAAEGDAAYCYDFDTVNLSRLPASIVSCPLSGDNPYEIYSSNFKEADIIIYSVPQDALEPALRSSRPFILPNSLLVSLSSVQAPSIQSLRALLPGGCTYLGCHPLFGPLVSTADGYSVALIEYDENDSMKYAFREALSEVGLLIAELTADEHDHYMSIVQALTHFCLLSFATTIATSEVSIEKLHGLRTPNFQFLFAFCCRVMGLKPTTTGSIQHNPLAAAVRNRFVEAAAKLNSELSGARFLSDAAQTIEQVRQPFRGADVEEGERISIAATDAIQAFEKVLQRHRRLERPFVFKHRVKGDIRIVMIKSIEPDHMLVEDASVEVTVGNKKRIAIRYNDTALENYKWMGIELPIGKNTRVCPQLGDSQAGWGVIHEGSA